MRKKRRKVVLLGFLPRIAKNNTRKRFVGIKSLVGKKSDTLAGIFLVKQ